MVYSSPDGFGLSASASA